MINLNNIIAVSAYERKTLFRSWFFRIFAILSLLFLFGINMGFFGNHMGARWTTRAIAANLPYINVLFINVAQAVIAVFLASEFLRRDKKLDTTEVIYARPVSNGEYVLGKTMGILTLFVGLVIAALVMSLVFNLIRQDTPVVWQAYIYYPLLITIPTLIFILGLSFFLMIIFRSQAVTFLVLLGYIGLTLFYFKGKLNGLMDYMAFNLPMVYSDFIQFADLEKILLHRFAYLFLGTGFIFATIRFLNRLPQTGRWNSINTIAFIAFVTLGGFLGYRYYDIFHDQRTERTHYLSLNNRFAGNPVVDIISNNLDLKQEGTRLVVSSEMIIRNPGSQSIDTLIFSLNPGFDIDSITSRAGQIDYKRNRQIIQIIAPQDLRAGQRSKINIYYSGVPDEAIAYLDIPDRHIEASKRIQVATVDKKPGIIRSNFLLLTPELFWYPVAGVGFNNRTFLSQGLDFVLFRLSVKPNPGLTAVAPGKAEQDSACFHFSPETDLNALSLVIGPYEKRSMEIDGVSYNLFLKPDHDFFSGFFTNITDTLASLIIEAKENYEYDDLDLYYPFKRINLVEVPIQFHAYERPFTQTIGVIQPEIILLPEKGAGLSTMDFARSKTFEERANRKRENVRSPEQIEVDQFKRLLQNTFFRNQLRRRPLSNNRQGQGGALINFQGDINYTMNPYCVFPLYYSYITGISSDDYPLFNSMLEIYLKEGFSVSPSKSFTGGISDVERANLALKDKSMTEMLSKKNNSLTQSLISQAGSFIILALKNRVGYGNFDTFLYYYLEDHAFKEISFNKFAADFYNEFNVDIKPYFETLNTSGKIATFVVSIPEFIRTRDEIGDVYLIRYKISNTGDAKGLVDITFRMPGQGGFGGGGGNASTEQRLYELNPGITKEIQITLYDMPRMVTVNTLISGNIPSTFSTFLRSATQSPETNLEEYERITEEKINIKTDGDIIVDNEDEGFSYVSVSNESKLKQYLDARKEQDDKMIYTSINPSRTPSIWTPVAHSAFYGESVRSALISAKGNGGNTATWETILPEAGFYDVYVYVPMSAMFSRPARRGDRSQGGSGRPGQGNQPRGPVFADQGFEYHYTISTGAGTEDVVFILENIEEGWNRLGSFYFPADTASIGLSNNTNGNRVFADAVKWVMRP